MAQNDTPQIDLTGAQRLAVAVLVDCITEALEGSPEAIYWLYSKDAAFYANLAGYDETKRLVTVARRCKAGHCKLTGRRNSQHYAQALSL